MRTQVFCSVGLLRATIAPPVFQCQPLSVGIFFSGLAPSHAGLLAILSRFLGRRKRLFSAVFPGSSSISHPLSCGGLCCVQANERADLMERQEKSAIFALH